MNGSGWVNGTRSTTLFREAAGRDHLLLLASFLAHIKFVMGSRPATCLQVSLPAGHPYAAVFSAAAHMTTRGSIARHSIAVGSCLNACTHSMPCSVLQVLHQVCSCYTAYVCQKFHRRCCIHPGKCGTAPASVQPAMHVPPMTRQVQKESAAGCCRQ